MTLEGKVAVITGASTGIGRSCASVLARQGMRLVLAARRAERLQSTVAELVESGAEVLGHPVDVGVFEEVQGLADAAMQAFGQVDVVFLKAGVPGGSPLLDIDLDAWRGAVDTNVFGLLHGIKAFLPLLLEQGDRGSLLTTSSGAGVHGTSYNTPTYAMTKNAQLTIMEALDGQLRDAGSDIHVGVVLPPLTRTNLAGDDLSIWSAVEKMLATSADAPALIEPSEVAEVILEGIRARSFWIEATAEQNERLFGGRDSGAVRRKEVLIRAGANAMLHHSSPDPYLW
ncbi:MAG TPA: SDR family NAD(P)-dependent oxidoreductase [Acidimicrobiales bacterium]|jgi:NAD(P)-dependent dehydrogenase (short-subunit alcohol dehydrogenase family)